MQKLDFKKSLDSYLAMRGKFRILTVPRLQYLMIDGQGDPNGSAAFKQAIEALYPVAYKLKFMSKLQEKDYVVPPLEGLWWADDMETFRTRDKSAWKWTLMLLVPEWITQQMFEDAVKAATEAKHLDGFSKLRMEWLEEGTCVQTLHVGPFEAETKTLDDMHKKFIPSHGLKPVKKTPRNLFE